ncbi:5-carboxymethyl-2-hydroxymuconate Delta-isomerase [Motilimonas pumila]|uniref:5-carboxymethyl-2-hydroxymuconate Delta-isomerase n=1 Tax=Motilimonas pumila TaxID=2303987 RepID=UPI0011C38CA0|nr:5-carboxymethyl-2-hydroxymuconate Delta-isomerase [Motilimonas pumila]
MTAQHIVSPIAGEILVPHVLIEYSQQLESQLSHAALMSDVHQVLVSSDLFQPQDIKVRMRDCCHAIIGGEHSRFIHVEVVMWQGRDFSQKKTLSNAILALLTESFPDVAAMSVDIRDCDKQTYSKRAPLVTELTLTKARSPLSSVSNQ